MVRAALAVLLVGVLFGCKEQAEPMAEPPEGEQQTTMAPQGNGQESVGVVSPAAGLASPVTGSDSVGGGGSGVGQAAKDQARTAASKAGGSSLDQMGDY